MSTETLTPKQEAKSYFGELTQRMKAYRESVLAEKPYICAERALLTTEAYKENLHKPVYLKRALMLKKILENMTIYIEDETLIVGNQASGNRNAPIFPEYTMEFVIDELDKFEKRDGDVFYITEETKEQLRSIAPFWKNKTLRDHSKALMPDYCQVFIEQNFFGMEGKMNAGDGHVAVDYKKLLEVGLIGYEERTKKLKEALDLAVPNSIDKYHFYDSVLIVIEAVKNFAHRYAELAEELAKTASPKRAEELREISRICRKVPYYPAETF